MFVQKYREVFQNSCLLLYGIYFLFFFFNHAFENSISMFFVAAGMEEKAYGIFLTAVNILDIVLPGLIAILAGKYGAYKFAYMGMLCAAAGSFAMTESIPLFIAGILFTMLKDVFAPVSFAYFYDCFPGEKAVAVSGLNSSIGNACSFFAPLVVGAVWAVSPRLTFGIGAASNLIAVLIAVLMLPDVKPAEN